MRDRSGFPVASRTPGRATRTWPTLAADTSLYGSQGRASLTSAGAVFRLADVSWSGRGTYCPQGSSRAASFVFAGGRSVSVLAGGGHLAAQHGAHEPQDRWPQDGEDPRVDDGIDREKPQGQEVPLVFVLFLAELVHVGADLQNTTGRNNGGSGFSRSRPPGSFSVRFGLSQHNFCLHRFK